MDKNRLQIPYFFKLLEKKDIDFLKEFHYSKSIPNSKFYFGFFENKRLVGVITFGSGANRNIGSPYGLKQNEIIELTRVSFMEHHNYLSLYISKCIKYLRKNTNYKKIISYADLRYHKGVLYKSSNFKLEGIKKMSGIEYFDENRWKHQRNLWKDFKKNNIYKLPFKKFVEKDFKTRPQSNKVKYYFDLKKYERK